MPLIKLSLKDDEFDVLQKLADAEKMSIQDLIRYKLLSQKNPAMFVPEKAVERALEKFTVEDEPFTLPDIYGEDWSKLNPHMTGVFGKRFFNHTQTISFLEFVGMTENGRRATYKIVSAD